MLAVPTWWQQNAQALESSLPKKVLMLTLIHLKLPILSVTYILTLKTKILGIKPLSEVLNEPMLKG